MPNLEKAVQQAIAFTRDSRYGYDQALRDTDRGIDCSSLVCRSLRAGGFGTPRPSFSTRTMGAWLESHQWVWHAGLSGVRRGDVVWQKGHTAMAISPTQIAEAYPNGTPLHGDEIGDNNGREVLVTSMWAHAWTGYWRYTGEEDEVVTDDDIQKIANAVWNFDQNGTLMRDRVQGTDGAANGANSKLAGMQEDFNVLCDRVYRSTSILKALAGIGAEDVSDPKERNGEIQTLTIGRLERGLRILKGMVGIGQEDTGKDAIKTPMHVTLSDDQMEAIADMVAERISKGGETAEK